jgi:GNAT superfamily N-acetyltransferase
MSGIRPLQEDDLPQVAALFELVMRSGSETAHRQLVNYFARLLDHPWADPEIPSLVSVDRKGRIVGFIGSHVRRLRFQGQRIRVGVSGQFVSHPDARNRAVGALLLRRYLAGPQDMTMTSAVGEAARIWKALGGQVMALGSIRWIRIFSLGSTAGYLLERSDKAAWKPVVRPLFSAAQALTDRLPPLSLRVRRPTTRAEDLSPERVLEHLPSVSDHFRIRPDYDQEFLDWIFREMAEVRSRGNLVKRLVLDANGRVLGWYVAYLQPGGVSQMMQIGAKERDVEAVLDHLLDEAQRSGVALLFGQLESAVFEPLTRRRCLLHPGGNFLVHSRNPQILDAVLTGQVMISRMEGEGWMGHAEPLS